MTITIDEAKVLNKTQTLYNSVLRKGKKGGLLATCRVNGKVKTWKRDPLRRGNFEIPCARGLYEKFKLYSFGDGVVDTKIDNTWDWWVTAEKALAAHNDAKLGRG